MGRVTISVLWELLAATTRTKCILFAELQQHSDCAQSVEYDARLHGTSKTTTRHNTLEIRFQNGFL
jgi:hypothetical protein